MRNNSQLSESSLISTQLTPIIWFDCGFYYTDGRQQTSLMDGYK